VALLLNVVLGVGYRRSEILFGHMLAGYRVIGTLEGIANTTGSDSVPYILTWSSRTFRLEVIEVRGCKGVEGLKDVLFAIHTAKFVSDESLVVGTSWLLRGLGHEISKKSIG
jgi:hypothetical protein